MLLEIWEDPDFGNESIGLIQWCKAGLESLLISPGMKRGIGERAVRYNRRGEHQIPLCPLNVAPTIHY